MAANSAVREGAAGGPPPRRPGAFRRGVLPALVVCGFVLFTLFLGSRLREGFDRQLAEDPIEAAEEPEEVVSRAIEFTVDEQGRPLLTVIAEEATGRSDGRQRFLGVTARFYETWEGGDAEIAADELLIDTGAGSLEFLGNALLVTEGLELGGPHLRFRRAPDHLWSNDPIQFSTDEFAGVALSFRFRLDTREVQLRGVTVVSRTGDSVSALAETAVFDPVSTDTMLFGAVELATDRVELTSRESVALRRDASRGRLDTVEAGFGTALRLLPRPEAEADPREGASDPGEGAVEAGSAGERKDAASEPDPESGTAAANGDGEAPDDPGSAPAGPVLYGDSVRIALAGGRRPERVVVDGSPLLVTPAGAELRGDRAELEFGDAGEAGPDGTAGVRSDRVRFDGEVRTELITPGETPFRVDLESERAEFTLDRGGAAAAATFTGSVEAKVAGTRATGDTAVWDGAVTLTVTGSPRVRDGSALDLEGGEVTVVVGTKTTIAVRGEVGARLDAERLSWLPGDFESAALFCETAAMESGSGRGVFDGGVRLLFGRSRFEAERLELDTGERTLLAVGGVETAMEVRTGAAAGGGGPAPAADSGAFPEAEVPLGGSDGDGAAAAADGAAAGGSGAGSVPAGTAPERTAFTASADRFEFRAAEGWMRWNGEPRLTVGPEGETATRVRAGEISAELTGDGALAGLVGERSARFEQAGHRAEGRRLRYEPRARRLTAWGAPARIEAEGRSSEGGRLVLDLDGETSAVEASRGRRATARTRLNRRRPGEGAWR